MSKQRELVQYYLVNTDLGMSTGKIGAQIAHASMIIALRDQYQENFQVWREIDMKKIVLAATEDRMREIIDENPTVVKIIDKGFTEIEPNSLTVIGFPVMTRREAYKWVHGLHTLRDNEISFQGEQDIIKKEAENNKGIFYVPKLGTYSASTLVENQHPIHLIEYSDDLNGNQVPYIENGGLGYIIGEIMFALDRSIVGEFYSYKVKGEQTHEHSLEGVYADVVKNYDTFEFIEPINEYFSDNQVKIIKAIIKYQKSMKNDKDK